MTRYVLGIDPGLSGALALYVCETLRTATPRIDPPIVFDLRVLDVPTHEIKVNGRKKRTLDLQALGTWFDLHRADIKLAVIENVHAMPAQGVTSSFNFGRAFGALEAMVAASIIPIHYVAPNVWKRHYHLTSDKDASRRKASQLFPAHAHLWARSKDDGRAEAVLLALWGAKIATT